MYGDIISTPAAGGKVGGWGVVKQREIVLRRAGMIGERGVRRERRGVWGVEEGWQLI